MATSPSFLPPEKLPIFSSSKQVIQTVEDFQGKQIAIVGLGDSGIAMARFCCQKGAHVIAYDDKPLSALTQAKTALQNFPITFFLEGLHKEQAQKMLLASDLIVLSPGVPPFLPMLQEAQAAKIPITGELELASRFILAPIVGITGTNGKSTVTSLCGAIAEQTGKPFFCGGNLGIPLIEAVGTAAAASQGIVVCEMSSFQLETVETLHCKAATILNVTPDHLERYASFENYGEAKAKIVQNQNSQDVLILNADDREVLKLQKRNFPNRAALYFSTEQTPKSLSSDSDPQSMKLAGFIQGDQLVLRIPRSLDKDANPEDVQEETYPLSELQIVGRHNAANALAAFLLMRASGLATYNQVRTAAKSFQPLPHRMQQIAVWKGITYYDDSKGTNVDAVAASLAGFPKPFALIAGGKDKGGSYAPLAQVLIKNQVRGVVLIGEAAPLIEKSLPSSIPCFRANTLEQAVSKATELCQAGDAVILSPACSSFDMFRNYLHRAEVFQESVFALIKQQEATKTPPIGPMLPSDSVQPKGDL